MSDSSDDMELYSDMLDCDEVDTLDDLRVQEVIKYCYRFHEQYWAARIISIFLGCDFRDSERFAKQYLERLEHEDGDEL